MGNYYADKPRPFEDTEKAAEAGRKGGKTKALKARQWLGLRDYLLGDALDKLIKTMDKLEGKDYINAYTVLIKYFKPQLQSTSVQSEGTINVVVVSEDKKLIDKV